MIAANQKLTNSFWSGVTVAKREGIFSSLLKFVMVSCGAIRERAGNQSSPRCHHESEFRVGPENRETALHCLGPLAAFDPTQPCSCLMWQILLRPECRVWKDRRGPKCTG